MVVNREYEGIVTSGLSVCLDAGYIPSYPISGTTFYNVGNNNNTLSFSLLNGVTYSTDGGGSLVFDGTDDEVVSDDRYTMVSGMTWSVWVKRTSDGNVFNMMMSNFIPYMAFRGTGSGSDINRYQVSYRTITGETTSQRNLYTTGSTFSNNIWYNFTYTLLYDLQNQLATAKIYVNGVFNTSSSNYTDSLYQPSIGSRLRLGNYTSNQYPFPGNIAILLLYERVLSDSEVLQNYNAQVSRFSASYDSDAQAFFTAAGITDTTQKNAVNQLVLDLKSYSIWNKMNAIYPFVGGTASTHKYNLKDPRDLNAAYRLSFAGGWTHSSNGVTPNGVNGYADTYFDGNVGAIGCYNRNTNFAMGTKYDEWEGGDYPVYSIPWIYLFGRSGTIQNTVDQQNTVNPAGASLPFAHITYDTQQRLYTNGNLVNSNAFYTSAPSAPTGYPIWIGGLNDNGRYNNPTYYGGTSSFSFISGTLNSTESANLNTAVQAFQTTLGRNV
jgi:hypothetical protein